MAKQAKLYQRLRTKKFPWTICPISKNGVAKPDPNAFAFGIRYSLDGERKLETFPTLDEAVAAWKRQNVNFYAATNGVAMPVAVKSGEKRIKIADAVETYYSNLAAQGKDRKTVATYRYAINDFVKSCSKTFIDQIDQQDMYDFMAFLRKQPRPTRKHSNPERTYSNKVGHIAVFLKAFGKSRLLKKSQYPQYADKPTLAHSDPELTLLYSKPNADEKFLLDYFLGSAVRDGEAAHAEYSDLSGNVLEIKRKPSLNWSPKQHHCRKVAIPQSLADSIRERGKKSDSPFIFPNGGGLPNHHLLRDLQDLAEKSGAKFHTELHKLRKTCATRWAVAGMPVHVIQRLLGHKSLTTTQKYLADVDLSGEAMVAAVEKAAFKP
jgi:integrase